ncbi:MAG: TonB-dependent receptor [Melioribacteraceae bacterium]|nr:TonB-dependent receptor [Melioribacteraceae bacterium]
MKFLIKFILVYFFIVSINYSQNTFKGKIINQKGEPVLGASVIVLGSSSGTSADENGFFVLSNIKENIIDIQISAVGYEKRIIKNVQPQKQINVILNEISILTNQIVVTAGKFEQNIQDLTVSTVVLSPEIIKKKNYITLDELLRNIAGIQMNLEQVSIRGSSGYSKGAGARVLVAINGLPIYSGDNGDIVWEMIPTNDIDRIEIIKGPASSLYGSSAIGGVINIITKTNTKNALTNFRNYIGFYDKPAYEVWDWSKSYRKFFGTELTHSNSSDKLGYTFSIKKFDNDSYRQSDFYKRILGYTKLNYNFNENDNITFFANYLNQNRGNFLYWKDSRNALVPKDEENGNTVKSNRLFTGIVYHNVFDNNLSADFKASYYKTKFTGYGVEITTSTADLFRTEAIANYKYNDKMFFTGGIEFSTANISSNIFKNPSFYGGAGYFQLEFHQIKNLIATFGTRFDLMKLDTLNVKSAITPRLGLNYKIDNNLVLRSSIGTGFRAPTPSEVFTTAGVGGGVDVIENPNLTYETSLSFETGLNYSVSNQYLLDAAFYQTDYNNFIEPNLTKEGDIQFINLPKARIQGFEFLFDWKITDELKINGGYNYMWARDLNKKIAMKYRPKNSFNFSARYTPSQFEFGIDYRFSSKVEEIDNALVQPPLALVTDGEKRVPVFVTDLLFGYNFFIMNIPTKIFFNVKNLLNYNYVEFIGNIAPIRNFTLSLEFYF